jgi:hypothetical protein
MATPAVGLVVADFYEAAVTRLEGKLAKRDEVEGRRFLTLVHRELRGTASVADDDRGVGGLNFRRPEAEADEVAARARKDRLETGTSRRDLSAHDHVVVDAGTVKDVRVTQRQAADVLRERAVPAEQLHDMAVDSVAPRRDAVVLPAVLREILLAQHVASDHAAALTNVELERPMTIVGELIPRQAKRASFVAEGLGQFRVVLEVVEASPS